MNRIRLINTTSKGWLTKQGLYKKIVFSKLEILEMYEHANREEYQQNPVTQNETLDTKKNNNTITVLKCKRLKNETPIHSTPRNKFLLKEKKKS